MASLFRQVVRKIYDEQPENFSGLTLVKEVRIRTGRHDVFADSVMRYLRELRQKAEINYECTDRFKSMYKKC